ncbi:MAG: carboxypeptidase [Ardenticatenales bacterium]|nr:carboxypeptidase [Ardenticatenales bacterium]
MPARFDTYYDNDDLSAQLAELVAAHPTLARRDVLGLSHEGREIELIVLTNTATGPDTDKPALWIDANIHATEVTASMAALYVIHSVLTRHDAGDEAIRRILDTGALYIVPRLNPDGAALALSASPRHVRSSTRRYPYQDKQDGLHAEDIDGNGRILQMRIQDPNGDWKASDHDPRCMVKRAPDEHGGTYYRVLPEGTIHNYDGHVIKLARPEQSLDLNRNFAGGWRPEGQQYGAGDYPGSEPEAQAVLRFFAAHDNVFGALTYHTYSRAILRPFSMKPDDEMDTADKFTYEAIGQRGTDLTGYPNVSVYHHFRYHPKEVISGVFDDWLYSDRGVFAFTVELWDLPTAAGIEEKNKEKRFIEWMRFHPTADDVKIFDWLAANAPDQLHTWTPFDHPQLGPVEVGGANGFLTWRNPPPHLLEAEIAPQAAFALAFADLAPRLAWRALEATALGDDVWRIVAVVDNTGFLATSASQQARKVGTARPVRLELHLGDGATLVGGPPAVEVGHLEGRASKMAGGWFSNGATDHRGKAEWLVRAPAGATLSITAHGARAGTLRGDVRLG